MLETPRRREQQRRFQAYPVLPTKVVAPRVPHAFVDRPRLYELLDAATDGRVTLVSARAGAGKTVLLSSWVADRPESEIAWLTLDRDDNWSPSFWFAVNCALDGAEAAGGNERSSGGAGGLASAAQVANRLSARQDPLVLVLDDFQEVENKVVLRELDALVLHALPQLRLVIATRADPPLRLQRLRLAGDLAQVRASELAFRPDECRAFLGPLAERLEDEDVEALCERTEGWAAGIRLAALSLERQADPAQFIRKFAGDDRAVADYLVAEVLERQEPHSREFLLRTSVPATLTVGLASELSGQPNSGRLLEHFELQNVAVATEADGERRYRYPALLRDFLQTQLRRTRPEELQLLCRRAARWHWRHGEPLVAFREAVSGEDGDLAEAIYAEAWPSLVLRPLATGLFGLPTLPPELAGKRPALLLEAASVELASPRVDLSLAQRLVAEAELALDDEPEDAAFESLATHATFLRVLLAPITGDFDGLEAAAGRLLEASGNHELASTGPARVLEAVALTKLGTASVAKGRLEEAELRLETAASFARATGAELQELNSLSQLGLVEISRGRLRRAAEVATEASEFAEQRGWTGHVQAVGAHISLAWAHYQWNDLETARRHLDCLDGSVDYSARLAFDVLGALISGAAGPKGADRGLRQLHGSHAVRGNGKVPFYLRGTLTLAEPRLLAARGDLAAARAALTRFEPDEAPDGYDVLLARLLLVEADPEGALEALADISPGPGPEQTPLMVEAAVLRAVARNELHDSRGSAEAFEQALELGGRNAYRRVFVDVGPSVRPLLEQQIRQGTSYRSFAGELVAALDRRAPSIEITKPELLEPLSERERAVLRYLPTLMSNAEIASELFVSVNTVKTHLRSIYRKLGATRRREAVERARRLELL